MEMFKEKAWESVGGAMPAIAQDKNAAPMSASRPERQWYAVHVRRQFEKKTASTLHRKGIETFLPVLREVHRWSDRRKMVEEPLFAGYAFVCLVLEPSIRLQILQTPGVLGFAGNQRQPDSVPQSQIEDLRRLLCSDAGCALRPFLHAGQRVRIRGGALDGIEGVLQKNDSKHLVISIECIQRSVAVKVDGYGVELV
jgi:transcription antitermination factor NusG